MYLNNTQILNILCEVEILVQARLNKGEFNPEKTRVLHYISNPETLAQKDAQQARLRDLEAENSILRSQLGNRQNQSSESERGDKQPQQNAVYEAEILVLRQKVRKNLETAFEGENPKKTRILLAALKKVKKPSIS